MKVFSRWVCALALLNAANAESRNDILSKELDGEDADWYNRMTQELGSVRPPQPPPTPLPTPLPTRPPTPLPTRPPTPQPTTPAPTVFVPTTSPSVSPTKNPTTSPSRSPTLNPTLSSIPTKAPTPPPTENPSSSPTKAPTRTPTISPSEAPTFSKAPSSNPTGSKSPTDSPSFEPTNRPSNPPSFGPTLFPTTSPSVNPTKTPTPPPTPRPTPPPTQSPTMTPLQIVPRLGVFFLQRCQGDCNADTDCAFGLVCLQRNRGQSSVSGCSGNADLIGNGDEDYCVPPAANQLVIMGDDINGVQQPAGAFPLGRCQGDCNNDGDCRGNLVCRQRDDNAAITGCEGRGATGFDYCYSPGPNDLVFAGDDDVGWTGVDPNNLPKCRGDCDEDTDCAPGLVCFQRDFEPRTVPGCSGDAFYLGNGDDDFCIQASSNTLNFRGDNGQPASAFPLGNCQGDCDDDSECAGNLRCFERSEFEDVPGCTGFGVSGFDYCANFSREGDEEENSTIVETPEEEQETEEQNEEEEELIEAAEEEKDKDTLSRFFLGPRE